MSSKKSTGKTPANPGKPNREARRRRTTQIIFIIISVIIILTWVLSLIVKI
jgi:hypothetical protein